MSMKPVNYYTFSLKLTRAIGRIQKIEKEILLKQQDSVKKVPVEEIYYVEIQNRMLYYHRVKANMCTWDDKECVGYAFPLSLCKV